MRIANTLRIVDTVRIPDTVRIVNTVRIADTVRIVHTVRPYSYFLPDHDFPARIRIIVLRPATHPLSPAPVCIHHPHVLHTYIHNP